MGQQVALLVWGNARTDWDAGPVTMLPDDVATAAARVDSVLDTTDAAWLLFWNGAFGAPDPAVVAALAEGRADAWHGGMALGTAGMPEEHDYIHPIWPLSLDPEPGVAGVSWRVSLDAFLVRTDVLRAVGGIDRAFHGRTGAGLELGRRLIDRGAVVMSAPSLVPTTAARAASLDEHDRFAFLTRVFGRKWVRYAAVRRALAHRRPDRVLASLRAGARSCAAVARPGGADRLATRPETAPPVDASVSVVLPTLGRYALLRPVLDQLRKQTIAPLEVIVVDQNDAAKRDHDLYREYEDLNVRVIFQDERGQWLARNAAVEAAEGEWLAFIDDDSEVGPDFIEQHLEGLQRYSADLSTGASLAVIGAPIPDNYAFFRVADQWDSGNGMCHRSLFEKFGLFDQQFDRQRRGDAEFGLRVQRGGGLVIHNPHAIRVHLKAQEGGLRTFGSLDGFRHRDRSAPLPLPSMVYYTKRYHSARQVREDLLIGLTQAIIPYELKRRASLTQWARFLSVELLHVPSTVRRVRSSLRIADDMVAEGPKIPRLEP